MIDALEATGTPPEALYDDNPELWGTTCLGYPIVGGRQELLQGPRDARVVIAIARNEVRQQVAKALAGNGLWLIGFRHPAAVISRHAAVSETAQVLAAVVINAAAQIGSSVIVNTGAIVEHDCRIGPFAHIGPGAVLAGAVEVLQGAVVGAGAALRPFAKVGAWATVGAGAVVIQEVPDGTIVAGVPARALRGKRRP